jgi:hypothetical protein
LDGFAHGGLDVDGLEVVPSLLEHGDEEVEGHHDVGLELFVVHVSLTDGASHTGDLSELELNGSSGVVDGGDKGLGLGDNGGEHLDSVKDGSDDNGDSLQTGVGSEEEIELLGPLLDELLVLVELLELIKGGDGEVTKVVHVLNGLDSVLLIGDEANLEVGSGVVGKSDGTDETLILLGIVILKTELELDGLDELALFSSSHGLNGFKDLGSGDLGGHVKLVVIY